MNIREEIVRTIMEHQDWTDVHAAAENAADEIIERFMGDLTQDVIVTPEQRYALPYNTIVATFDGKAFRRRNPGPGLAWEDVETHEVFRGSELPLPLIIVFEAGGDQ